MRIIFGTGVARTGAYNSEKCRILKILRLGVPFLLNTTLLKSQGDPWTLPSLVLPFTFEPRRVGGANLGKIYTFGRVWSNLFSILDPPGGHHAGLWLVAPLRSFVPQYTVPKGLCAYRCSLMYKSRGYSTHGNIYTIPPPVLLWQRPGFGRMGSRTPT